jgi:hypothetical protein
MQSKKRMTFLAITLMLLASTITLSVPITTAQEATIAFALGQGQGDKLLDDLKGNLTAVGDYTFVDVTELTETSLEGVDVLVLGAVYGANFTEDDLAAIGAWFSTGEKGIWVCGDSDYYGLYMADNPNAVLEEIGSKMRVEASAVEDPGSNAGSAYRVVANVPNTDDAEVADIVDGVTQALFHGPDLICGWGSYIPLDTESVENVFPVMSTSDQGVINDKDLIGPYAHENADTGNFVMMAAEIYAGPDQNSKIIASGASAYGDYQPICTDEYYGVPMEGMTLVVNAIVWLATVLEMPAQPAIPGFPIEALIIGIALTAAALMVFKKEPKISF